MPVTQKRSKKTAAKSKKPTVKARSTQSRRKSVVKAVKATAAMPQAQSVPSLPSTSAGTSSLASSRQWPRWAPYFGGLAIIALAVTGALLFSNPSNDMSDSSQGITLGESDSRLQESGTEPATWSYQYTWTGGDLSTVAPDQKPYTESIRKVTAEEFTAIARKFGIEGEIRSSSFDDNNAAYEAGVATPSIAPDGQPEDGATPDVGVLKDPEAYQLYAYAQDNRYWYSLLSNAEWLTTHQGSPLPSTEEAKSLANDYLKARDLLPSDAEGPFVMDIEQNSPVVSVYYTQTINGLPVVDGSGEVQRYVIIEFSYENKVLNVSGPILESDLTEESQTIESKSVQVAWDELRQNQWGPGRDFSQGQPGSSTRIQRIDVSAFEPAYLQVWNLTTDSKRVYEPVYRFSGSIQDELSDDTFPYYIIVPMSTDGSAYAASLAPTHLDDPDEGSGILPL